MSLTTTMGVKLGPIVLGTLFKHYLERHNVTRDSKARNELLFDEAFIVVKSFMEESTKHTVEELQQFSNTRIPSPPWVHNVRVLIPLSCCDEAAPLLLQALGGPDAVGGSKWWQVRGVRGVDAQWVAVKRDWRDAERRRKQRQDDSTRAQTTDTERPGDHPARHNTVSEHSRKESIGIGGLRRSQTAVGRTKSGSVFASGRGAGGLKRPASSAGVRSTLPTVNGSGSGRVLNGAGAVANGAAPVANGAQANGNGAQANGNDASPPSATIAPHLTTTPTGTNPHTPIPSRSPSPMPPTPRPQDPEGPKPQENAKPRQAENPRVSEEVEDGEAHYEPEMDDMRCMLYIHGGGYYFGSVDQQRYCVQRYARKMGGRVLAVNYRLAPQYPFPCALHDCLAAYLYLIRPPKDAEHLPVPPNMVIIAGDSAGGGMTLALLQIIRDVGLPAPAGGVLISPWCDLTHSFPSVLTNTTTDIIPPYGLSLHKPSTLWPPPSDEFTTELHSRLTTRVREVVKRGKNKLGLGPAGSSEVDLATLVSINKRSASGDHGKEESTSSEKGSGSGRKVSDGKGSVGRASKWWKRGGDTTARGNSYVPPPAGATFAPTVDGGVPPDPPQPDCLGLKLVPSPETSVLNGRQEGANAESACANGAGTGGPKKAGMAGLSVSTQAPSSPPTQDPSTPHRDRVRSSAFSKKQKHQTTADPSKGEISVEIDGEMKTVRSQIQLYAQNHQLTHPLVSPALGYLGGLPPLFVLASDKEVLRDEIIYVAHKAAHPDRYPVKPESRERLSSLKGIEEKGYPPTLVHLQVYDETCHVLPLFSFTTPAKYCYRAIALFCKHVTARGAPSIPPTPTLPDGSMAKSPELEPALLIPDHPSAPGSKTPSTPGTPPIPPTSPRRLSLTSPRSLTFSPSLLRRRTSVRRGEPPSPGVNPSSPTSPTREPSDDIAGPRFNLEKNEPPTGVGTAGDPSVYGLQAIGQPGFTSPFVDNMIRERVSTSGVLRPLEPESELPACNLPLENMGVINASAVKRYLEGQALWDAKFSGTIKGIAKMRAKNLELARKEGRKSMGTLHGALASEHSGRRRSEDGGSASSSMTFLGSSTWNMSWALDGENPPPSSIVSRRDTAEARRLAMCADRDMGEESKMSGNNLWSVVVDFLTKTPDRNAKSTDPLVADNLDAPTPTNDLNINVVPPTPSSPAPPLDSPSLIHRRSSTFLRKLMGKDTGVNTPKTSPKRPMSVIIDSNRNPGLPLLDKP